MNVILIPPKEKVAIVTGAAGGMGRSHVRALLESGWNVAACDRDEAGLKDLVGDLPEYGDHVISYGFDVTSDAAVEEIVTDAGKLGLVLALVNNAGIGSAQRLFSDISLEEWWHMLDVHLLGTVRCIRAALGSMQQAGFGRIVNVSSYCAEVGSAGYSHYCAAKAALIGLSASLAREVAGSGITVNVVAPGLIETPMTASDSAETRAKASARIPLQRYGRPEEVSALVRYLVSEEASYVTGQVMRINGGMVIR